MLTRNKKKLKDQGDIIKIGYNECKLYDRFHVTQCSKCWAFGHVAQNCRTDFVTCTFCSENHSYKDCKHKSNITLHKCTNCLKSSNNDIKNSAQTHNSYASSCPIKQQQLQKLISRTDSGQKSL